MWISILGSRSFSSVLAAGYYRLIGRQFLPMLLSLSGFRIIAFRHHVFQVSVQLRLKD